MDEYWRLKKQLLLETVGLMSDSSKPRLVNITSAQRQTGRTFVFRELVEDVYDRGVNGSLFGDMPSPNLTILLATDGTQSFLPEHRNGRVNVVNLKHLDPLDCIPRINQALIGRLPIITESQSTFVVIAVDIPNFVDNWNLIDYCLKYRATLIQTIGDEPPLGVVYPVDTVIDVSLHSKFTQNVKVTRFRDSNLKCSFEILRETVR